MIARALAVPLLLFAANATADDPGTVALQRRAICHSLNSGGANRVGRNLFGVFGRKAGSVARFNYSPAMRASGIVWDDETLAKFLRGPKDSLPGNRMSFPGIMDEAMLHDLLQKLKLATQ